MSGISIKCNACGVTAPVRVDGVEDHIIDPPGWTKVGSFPNKRSLCPSCSGSTGELDDATKAAVDGALAALDGVMLAELGEKPSNVSGKYVRIERLARLAGDMRRLYARRVDDALGGSFGGDDDYAIRPVYGGAVPDQTALLRETLMTAQSAATTPKPMHPVDELERLIEARETLQKRGENVDALTVRIEALKEQIAPPPPDPAKVQTPSPSPSDAGCNRDPLAVYCPVHGSCRCTTADHDDPLAFHVTRLVEPSCPLHGTSNRHAPVEKAAAE